MNSHHSRRNVLRGATMAGLGLAVGGDLLGVGLDRAASASAAGGPLPGTSASPPSVQVSHDDFAVHAETSVAVNPRDPRNLIGASIVVDLDQEVETVATYASFDGGSSWQSAGPLPGLPGGDDPSVAFDARGHGYVCTGGGVAHVWRTEDGGRSFIGPVQASPGKMDRPSLTAAPSALAAGHLYAVWTTGPDSAPNTQVGFVRSVDGGRSFEPQRVIATATGPSEANLGTAATAAGPGGMVYASYMVAPPLPPGTRGEIPGRLRVVQSADGGQTWAAATDLGDALLQAQVTPDTTSACIAAIASSGRRHLVGAAFIIRRPGAPFTDIVLRTSTSQGRHWSAPVLLSRGNKDITYFQPQLAISEDGQIAVTAFGYRQGRVSLVLFTAPHGAPPFAPPFEVTPEPFDPTLGPSGGSKDGGWWIGDYQGLAWGDGRIHPFWNDTRTGRLEVFTATINGTARL